MKHQTVLTDDFRIYEFAIQNCSSNKALIEDLLIRIDIDEFSDYLAIIQRYIITRKINMNKHDLSIVKMIRNLEDSFCNPRKLSEAYELREELHARGYSNEDIDRVEEPDADDE